MQVPHAQPLHGASATGPSTVLLDTTLPAGSHTYIVSGVAAPSRFSSPLRLPETRAGARLGPRLLLGEGQP
jgi:hypothetical protein